MRESLMQRSIASMLKRAPNELYGDSRARALSYVHPRSSGSRVRNSRGSIDHSRLGKFEQSRSSGLTSFVKATVVGEGRDDVVAGDENVKGGHRGRDFAVACRYRSRFRGMTKPEETIVKSVISLAGRFDRLQMPSWK